MSQQQTYWSYRNLHEALPRELGLLMNTGDIVESRDGLTRELRDHVIRLEHPLERVQFRAARRGDIFATVAETLWVLAGRNDIEWLARFLPRAPLFSDDGVTWRAGYGPRLRAWSNDYDNARTVDQLVGVAELLRRDPNTRRAVVSLWDPEADLGAETKDVPCNDWLHFIARNGVVDLKVGVRSNDAWWGWSGINCFEWSVLLELVALWAGMEVGSVTYFQSSFHLYERHWKRARILLDQSTTEDDQPYDPRPKLPTVAPAPRLRVGQAAFDDELSSVFAMEAAARDGGPIRPEGVTDPFLQVCAGLLTIRNYAEAGADPATLRWLLLALTPCDLTAAAYSQLLLRERRAAKLAKGDVK